MIDWGSVLTNSLWIGGLAATLALLSYADWQASAAGRGSKAALCQALSSPGLAFSLALVCLGGGLCINLGWQRAAWFLLTICLLVIGTRRWLGRDPGTAA
jgi:hypothetical protein